MIVDVRVRVCCATGVTTAEEEEGVEVDEVVDGVVEGVIEGVVEEVVEVDVLFLFKTERLAVTYKWKLTTHDDEVVLEVVEDVGELPAEDLDDALDVLSLGVGVELGLALGLEFD